MKKIILTLAITVCAILTANAQYVNGEPVYDYVYSGGFDKVDLGLRCIAGGTIISLSSGAVAGVAAAINSEAAINYANGKSKTAAADLTGLYWVCGITGFVGIVGCVTGCVYILQGTNSKTVAVTNSGVTINLESLWHSQRKR